MGVLAALIAGLIAGHAQSQSVRAGVMVASAGIRILAMEGPRLAVGSPLTVVAIEDPQQASRATIVRQVADSDVMAKHDMPGPFYELAAEPGSEPLPNLAVVILGRAHAAQVGDAVTLRLDDPPMNLRVRSCTSSEGLHLTLWAGTPLKSRRLWHTYYYLGYDVTPTCTPADYAEGGRPTAVPDGPVLTTVSDRW
jgi:hypothetical protein